MSTFNGQWHKQAVALEWPRGSVVLMRSRDETSQIHRHAYVLSLFFAADTVSGGRFSDWEFMLVEERKAA